MKAEVVVPKGWRLVEPEERIRPGDRYIVSTEGEPGGIEWLTVREWEAQKSETRTLWWGPVIRKVES